MSGLVRTPINTLHYIILRVHGGISALLRVCVCVVTSSILDASQSTWAQQTGLVGHTRGRSHTRTGASSFAPVVPD